MLASGSAAPGYLPNRRFSSVKVVKEAFNSRAGRAEDGVSLCRLLAACLPPICATKQKHRRRRWNLFRYFFVYVVGNRMAAEKTQRKSKYWGALLCSRFVEGLRKSGAADECPVPPLPACPPARLPPAARPPVGLYPSSGGGDPDADPGTATRRSIAAASSKSSSSSRCYPLSPLSHPRRRLLPPLAQDGRPVPQAEAQRRDRPVQPRPVRIPGELRKCCACFSGGSGGGGNGGDGGGATSWLGGARHGHGWLDEFSWRCRFSRRARSPAFQTHSDRPSRLSRAPACLFGYSLHPMVHNLHRNAY